MGTRMYGGGGGYGSMKIQRKQPGGLLNTLFMTSVNMATKMLLSVTSNNFLHSSAFSFNGGVGVGGDKWKVKDHLRFMCLILSWFTMWAFRLASDFFPSLSLPSSTALQLAQHQPAAGFRRPSPRDHDHHHHDHGHERLGAAGVSSGGGSNTAGGSSSCSQLAVVSPSSTSLSSPYDYSPVQNLDLISHDGFLMDGADDDHHQDGQSVEALGRALSHILSLLSELPATSRKYEFAMAMADRLLEDNTRGGHIELLQVNRIALSSAFECTTTLLHRTLNQAATSHAGQASYMDAWTTRVIRKLPLGSYITAYMKGGLSAIIPALDSMYPLQKKRLFSNGNGNGNDNGGESCYMRIDHSADVLGAEKLAQELLWITNKLRASHAVDEALVQWSLASGLASLSLNANPRVQALFIKLSASLIGDIAQADYQVPTQVQYRLLVLWLPLFCYASNGLRYPALSSYEKIEVERTMEHMIAGLLPTEQEIVLRNWLQDFAICSSDWPNLRPSYDRWCQSSRRRVA